MFKFNYLFIQLRFLKTGVIYLLVYSVFHESFSNTNNLLRVFQIQMNYHLLTC